MRIKIVKIAFAEFQITVVDGNGQVRHRYTYRTIESARRAAMAWSAL
jgi:hypothetical protein